MEKRYYVVYIADGLCTGAAEIGVYSELNNYEAIDNVAKEIAKKNDFKRVVILNWKELKNR